MSASEMTESDAGRDPAHGPDANDFVPAADPRPVSRPPARVSAATLHRKRQRRAVVLFLLTCLSTWYIGTVTFPDVSRADGTVLSEGQLVVLNQLDTTEITHLRDAQRIQIGGMWGGLKYSIAVMSILLAHEMGHYLQTLRYGVPATLPFFIPMPISPFGTMGAVIFQGAGTANRKSMFDIAISGPLAGLVVAIPILILGIQSSEYIRFDGPVMRYGDPLLVKWLGAMIHGTPSAGEDLILTPLLFAGWVGVFITSLNLIPVGQLDGGHLLYCLIGKRAHDFALMVVGFAIGYCVFVDSSYTVIIVLLLMMGVKHPPTGDDTVLLGRGRRVAGWLTLAFIVIGFTPRPFMFGSAEVENPPQADYRAVDSADDSAQ